MSVSKYRYTPSCDGQPCPGDCDLCGKEDDMDDLISRQAAIDAIDSLYFDTIDDHDRAKEKIKRLPSAQPEIIRCKDCKHRPFDGEDTQGFGVEFPDEKCPCQCDDGWYNWRPNNEWFCANAERRTDE